MIYLVRHGETDEDAPENPKFSGPGAIPLNAEGRKQSYAAAEWLKSKNIYWLLSSPIPRSSETADIVGQVIERPVKIFQQGRDWNNGAAAGNTIEKILPFTVFFERNPDLMIPGGEQYAAWWNTQGGGFNYLLDQPYEQLDIALVTHSRWIAVSKMRIEGKGMEPTDFNGSPKPGGIVAISKNPDSSISFDLVFGEWNGETRRY